MKKDGNLCFRLFLVEISGIELLTCQAQTPASLPQAGLDCNARGQRLYAPLFSPNEKDSLSAVSFVWWR